MTDRQPVALSDDEIAAVRSWVVHEDAHLIAFNKPSSFVETRDPVDRHAGPVETLAELRPRFTRHRHAQRRQHGLADEVLADAAKAGVPAALLGYSGGPSLIVKGLVSLELSDIKAAHEAWLPGYMSATE